MAAYVRPAAAPKAAPATQAAPPDSSADSLVTVGAGVEVADYGFAAAARARPRRVLVVEPNRDASRPLAAGSADRAARLPSCCGVNVRSNTVVSARSTTSPSPSPRPDWKDVAGGDRLPKNIS
jgi:hypothetical protein